MPRVEVLAVGRELLTGRTLESNANWIARRVSTLGGRLSRIAIVDDAIEAIAGEIRPAKLNGADVLLITGGLGPTFDDMTLAGLARAVGLELIANLQALQFIEDQYNDLHVQGHVPVGGLTPEREKMAQLPAGAQWFENPVGTAPGVRLDWDGMTVFCFPGVPREIWAMFDLAASEFLAKLFGCGGFAEVTFPTDEPDESLLTRIAQKLNAEYPGLYVKTNPTYFGDAEGLKITLSLWSEDRETAERIVHEALEKLKAELEANATRE